MKPSALRCVLWKEYRALRAFWLPLALLVMLGQVYLWAILNDPVSTIFGLAVASGGFYAVGCLAALFAGECDEGTDQFLRNLPASPRQLVGGKFLFAAISTFAIMACTWLFGAWLLGRSGPDSKTAPLLIGFWGLAAIEGVIYGGLFSMLFKQPLGAACLAIAAVSIVINVAAGVVSNSAHGVGDLKTYTDTFIPRVACALAVSILDIALARHWPLEGWSLGSGRRHTSRSLPLARYFETFRWPARLPLARLFWQSWRQAWPLIVGIVGVSLAMLIVIVFDKRTPDIATILSGTIVSAVAATLLGCCVFQSDQRRYQFRFFADRGVSPRGIWLARQLFWLAMLVPETQLIMQLLNREVYRNENHPEFALPWWWGAALIALAYAAGQFSSLMLRSPLLAVVAGLFLSWLVCTWTWMMYYIGMPLWWSVLPILIALFAATYLRAPGWLFERSDWRAWMPVILVIGIPVIAIGLAVPYYRVYQVPDVDPGFDVAAFDRPITAAEKETVELYRRAATLFTFKRPVDELVDGESPLALFLKASERPDCMFFDPGRASIDSPLLLLGRLGIVGDAILKHADQLTGRGQFDEALRCYTAVLQYGTHWRRRAPLVAMGREQGLEVKSYQSLVRWSADSRQDPSRICQAIEEITAIRGATPLPQEQIKSEYLRYRRAITTDANQIASAVGRVRMDHLWFWLPSERARARRVLNLYAREAINWLNHVEEQVAERNVPNVFEQWYRSFPRMLEVTPVMSGFYHYTNGLGKGLARGYVDDETIRRGLLILTSLEAWKHEHGELPKSLGELAGDNLKELPTDPFTGSAFEYMRDGVPVEMNRPRELSVESELYLQQSVPQNTPFLWSAGPRIYLMSPGSDDLTQKYILHLGYNNKYTAYSDLEIWQAGWVFPIP